MRRESRRDSHWQTVFVGVAAAIILGYLFGAICATSRDKRERDPSMSEQNLTQKTMKCTLTPAERLEYASEVGRETQLHAAARERRKEVLAQLNADVEQHRTAIDRLGTLLANGYEYRTVECVEALDYDAAVVRVTRTDTGEIVDVRAMTPGERQRRLPLGPAEPGRPQAAGAGHE